MDPAKIYRYLVLARQRIFDRIRSLDTQQYAQEFPIGPGTIGKTLTHIMISEWYYIQRLLQRDVPPYDQWPIQDEHPPPFATLEAEWKKQAADTQAALEAVDDWTTIFDYHVRDDEGRRILVRASAADIAAQLALHEMHHRAQVLNMLRRLGVTFDEDLDFNSMMYERREVEG